MSTRVANKERKIDLANLGQFYSPITFYNYGPNQTSFGTNEKQSNPNVTKKIENILCSPNVINNTKTIKVKFEKVSSRINESFGKKNNNNNSYNMSRNDNNMNENTTISTLDDKNINSSIEENPLVVQMQGENTYQITFSKALNN